MELSKLLCGFYVCFLMTACAAKVTPDMWNAAEQGCKDQGGILSVYGWLNASDDVKEVRVICRNGSELYLKI